MFKFLKSLFSSSPDYVPNPAASLEQKRALACGAVLGEINGAQHEWLHGGPPDQVSAGAAQGVLSGGWEVNSRDDLLGTLHWLETEGHRVEYEKIRALFERKGEFQQDASELIRDEPWAQRLSAEQMVTFRNQANGMLEFWREHKSLLGWDLGRANWVCRWGALAGYLKDDEAWQRIMGYAEQLRREFRSWAELGQNYRAGFNFWSDEEEDDDLVDALERLSNPKNQNSPWVLIPWR